MLTTRIFAVKIRVANFEILTTRIFAVKIRVANSETPTTRRFAVKIRVANFEMQTTWIFAVKIRVASFEIRIVNRLTNSRGSRGWNQWWDSSIAQTAVTTLCITGQSCSVGSLVYDITNYGRKRTSHRRKTISGETGLICCCNSFQCKTQLVHGTFSCRLKRGTRCFSLCCTYGTVKNPHGCWKRTKRRDFNDKCIYRRKPWLLKTILQMNYQTVINLPGQCVRMSMTIYYCVSCSISTTRWRLLTRLQ